MKGYLVVFSFLAVLLYACDSNEITSVQSDSFIKYYALNRTNVGTCVCEIPGGGYALLGYTTTDLMGTEICLILTDAYGNSIQRPKYYGNRKDDKGYCIKTAPGGGFVILGSTHVNENEDKDVWLIRTDNLGDKLWDRTFKQFDRENGDDEGLWFDFNSKGDIMMVGYQYLTDYNGDYSKQMWIYLVDENGDQINSNEPRHPGGKSDVDEARFVQCIDGDNFLITGVSNLFNNPRATSYSYIGYVKSDYSEPVPKESCDYISDPDTSTLRDEANCLIPVDNNTLLLSGSRVRTSGISEAYLCTLKMFNDDNQFDPDLEWIQYYNTSGSSKATHMLMEAGSTYLLSTVSSTSDKSSTITVITTGPDGNDPVYIPIGGSSKMESSNFCFTDDGGFIISGTNINKDINDIKSIALIKTKAGGRL
jgi:hypothetical protein